jgi:hypothetical protein
LIGSADSEENKTATPDTSQQVRVKQEDKFEGKKKSVLIFFRLRGRGI